MSRFLAPIHGMLFNKIKISEDLGKELINSFSGVYGEEVNVIVNDINEKYGEPLTEGLLEDLVDSNNIHGWLQNKIAISETRQAKLLGDLIKIYEALNAYILEDMPCDNANNITVKEIDLLEWKNTNCLHRGYWKIAGANVQILYSLRFSWIKTFIETINPQFTHIVKPEGATFIHQIVRE